jgi:hypothetical protein
MKHLIKDVYQVCPNKSPWFKLALAKGPYIQVNDFRAIMALLFDFIIFTFLKILVHFSLVLIFLKYFGSSGGNAALRNLDYGHFLELTIRKHGHDPS